MSLHLNTIVDAVQTPPNRMSIASTSPGQSVLVDTHALGLLLGFGCVGCLCLVGCRLLLGLSLGLRLLCLRLLLGFSLGLRLLWLRLLGFRLLLGFSLRLRLLFLLLLLRCCSLQTRKQGWDLADCGVASGYF